MPEGMAGELAEGLADGLVVGRWGQRKPSRAVTAGRRRLDRSHCRLNNGQVQAVVVSEMVSSLSQAEVLIALVVAAHAGVLAVRLSFSLYKA